MLRSLPRAPVQLHARSRQAAPSAAARRPLSAAHQSHWAGAGGAVAVLYPARRDRGRLQDYERRSAPAPDPSSARTLRARLKPLAPGLTPRAVLDKFAAIQMLDVHFPTTDGRTLILSRYTELTADQKILARHLKLDLPPQPPPRITAPEKIARLPANAV